MPRYALLIEYNGAPFAGWQRQASVASVQGAIEDALLQLEPQPAAVQGAGRTDAGVHATGQVAHVDLAKEWTPFRLSEALNHHLKPLPVSVLQAALVDPAFHARFSAIERRYTYRIIQRRAPLSVEKGMAWRVVQPLDVAAMEEGAAHLVGHHDFTTFRSSICQAKSPEKTLDEVTIDTLDRPGGAEIRLHFRARSFLHNQVRSLVGTLERVGTGKWAAGEVGEALAARDRARCGPVAPPEGLYLTAVRYPEKVFDVD